MYILEMFLWERGYLIVIMFKSLKKERILRLFLFRNVTSETSSSLLIYD